MALKTFPFQNGQNNFLYIYLLSLGLLASHVAQTKSDRDRRPPWPFIGGRLQYNDSHSVDGASVRTVSVTLAPSTTAPVNSVNLTPVTFIQCPPSHEGGKAYLLIRKHAKSMVLQRVKSCRARTRESKHSGLNRAFGIMTMT